MAISILDTIKYKGHKIQEGSIRNTWYVLTGRGYILTDFPTIEECKQYIDSRIAQRRGW